MIELFNGDVLSVLPLLPNNSVDMVFADLPYGITDNKWDKRIPLDSLWKELLRVGKDKTPYVFTTAGTFTYELYNSNPKMYKYKWVWNKNNSAGFALAKYRPFQITEDILVFGGSKAAYYPIMEVRGKPRNKYMATPSTNYAGIKPRANRELSARNNVYYPKNILNIGNANQAGKINATQKPIALLEYLIQTYTQEGDVVLDPTMGSGTTAIAARRLNRDFIGIEIDEAMFNAAQQRIENEDI
jgi:site-specific DNA-methyltransferase (adenine-specific)